MPPNSLFAVLLRKPWWASGLIAGAISLAAAALLPPAWVVVGVLSSFPFMVVAAMAAWRQRDAPDAKAVEHTLVDAAAMGWPQFQKQVHASLVKQGYVIEAGQANSERQASNKATRPVADVLASKEGRTLVIACKRWKAASPGVEALRELKTLQTSLDADTALHLSLQPVSESAAQFAQAEGVQLLHGDALGAWLLAGSAS